MAFIQFEATFALAPEECWWPEHSPEFEYWMECFGQKKAPQLVKLGGVQIPHQRDAEMASRSAGTITA
jgi:hypothetical protein